MTEVRTTSSTGGEKGMKPERHDLLPREGIEAIARVFAFGATKYADHNWRKGYEWSKSYSALQRHLYAFWSGETLDPESGLPHLAHAGFHILVLLTWLDQDGEGSQFDDRYRPPMEDAVAAALKAFTPRYIAPLESPEEVAQAVQEALARRDGYQGTPETPVQNLSM